MRVMLPDFLSPNIRVVFCGTAASKASGRLGHYYAGPGNDFWRLLFESGLSPILLRPNEDRRVLDFGIGLTDLAKGVAASSDVGLKERYDVDGFARKMEKFKPGWIAFHGKEAASAASRLQGHGHRVRLGSQTWSISGCPVFVVPSASGSNRDLRRLEGKASRLEWFIALRELL